MRGRFYRKKGGALSHCAPIMRRRDGGRGPGRGRWRGGRRAAAVTGPADPRGDSRLPGPQKTTLPRIAPREGCFSGSIFAGPDQRFSEARPRQIA